MPTNGYKNSLRSALNSAAEEPNIDTHGQEQIKHLMKALIKFQEEWKELGFSASVKIDPAPRGHLIIVAKDKQSQIETEIPARINYAHFFTDTPLKPKEKDYKPSMFCRQNCDDISPSYISSVPFIEVSYKTINNRSKIHRYDLHEKNTKGYVFEGYENDFFDGHENFGTNLIRIGLRTELEAHANKKYLNDQIPQNLKDLGQG